MDSALPAIGILLVLSGAQLWMTANAVAPTIYGIMVTRSDYWVLHTWLALHAWQFEKLVILDGTPDSHSIYVRKAAELYDNIIYASERDMGIPSLVTDNSLRGVAWSLIPNKEDLLGSWVVVAHPDEFYLQRFADVAARADAEGFNAVLFSTLYALPYSQDAQHLEIGIRHGFAHFNILDRVRYCQSDYYWAENRMHKYDSSQQLWGTAHYLTVPEHFPGRNDANWRGWYIHYKLHNFDADAVASDGTLIHSRWSSIGNSDIYGILGEHPAELCANIMHDLCTWPPADTEAAIAASPYLQMLQRHDDKNVFGELDPFCRMHLL